jgi:SAM-dependent methyltransferase
MKDNFSSVAGSYATYRPEYPASLYNFIFNYCKNKESAWDCGTGNGQVAIKLAGYFQRIYATDISQEQINNAFCNDRITYKVEAAESCSFPDQSFDLITVGQAVHWFDFSKFYAQVKRTLKPNGLLAIIGYGLIQSDDDVNKVLVDLYRNTLGKFWDPERKYIDEQYKTIPFPFYEIEIPVFSIEVKWNLNQLLGYLQTWSAVQHYRKENKQDPIQKIQTNLAIVFKNEEIKKMEFPVFLRLGKLQAF